MNSILALDLGLSLGWALDKQGVSYGEVAFHSAHRPMRWVHFADWLADRLASYAPELVVYERVVGVHRNGAHAGSRMASRPTARASAPATKSP